MPLFKWIKQKVSDLLAPRPKTEGYRRPGGQPAAQFHFDDRPRFSMLAAEMMLFDPKITLGMAIRNGLLKQMEVEILGGHPKIRAFVQKQWEKIWTNNAATIMRTKNIGYQGLEVLYQEDKEDFRGKVVFKGLRDFHCRDVRPLIAHGRVVGMNVRGGVRTKTGAGFNSVQLWEPKSLWLTYKDQYSSFFGQSLLEHAYPPWFEKWDRGGAVQIRNLKMRKDAYRGPWLEYPAYKTMKLPTGEVISFRDVAREILENLQTGAVFGIPSDMDTAGHKYFEFHEATEVPGNEFPFRYKDQLDSEMLDGIEVPEEIVQAASSGSGFSGRSIPFTGVLAALQDEGSGYVQQVDEQVLRNLVRINFAVEPSYTILAKSLIKTVGKIMGGGQQDNSEERGGNPGQGGMSPGMRPGMGGMGGFGGMGGGRAISLSSLSDYGPRLESNGHAGRGLNRLSPRKSSPTHGSIVGGVYYPPGEWIDAEAVQLASSEEIEQLAFKEDEHPRDDDGEFTLSSKPKRGKADSDAPKPGKQGALFAGRGDSPGQASFFDDVDPGARNVGDQGADKESDTDIKDSAIDQAREKEDTLTERKREKENRRYARGVVAAVEKRHRRELRQLENRQSKEREHLELVTSHENGWTDEEWEKHDEELGKKHEAETAAMEDRHYIEVGDAYEEASNNPSPHLAKERAEEDAAVIARRKKDDAPSQLADHWITIGGKEHGGKKHHGGFPVKIDADGRILAGGPKALRGKHVSEVGKHFDEQRAARDKQTSDEARELDEKHPAGKTRDYSKIVAHQADKWGMSGEDYNEYAAQVWKEKADEHKEREAAKSHARNSLNLTQADINRLENQGIDYGSKHKRVKGLDTTGREMASLYPSLGWGEGYGDEAGRDYAENVWELIKEGKQELPSRVSREFHDAVDDYLEGEMRKFAGSHKASKSTGEYDNVQFADGTPELHQFSSTQFDLPPEMALEVLQLGLKIPADDLAEDGRESQPHITVKFGLHTNDENDVRRAVQNQPPVAIRFGPVSCFLANEETVQRGGAAYDVVKIEVEGDGIRKLNALISESLQCTDTHPTYVPHCTIAYVKPGLGVAWAKRLGVLEGRTVLFERLTFSGKDRRHVGIALLGQMQLSTDAEGHEHSPAGSSEGGQFTKPNRSRFEVQDERGTKITTGDKSRDDELRGQSYALTEKAYESIKDKLPEPSIGWGKVKSWEKEAGEKLTPEHFTESGDAVSDFILNHKRIARAIGKASDEMHDQHEDEDLRDWGNVEDDIDEMAERHVKEYFLKALAERKDA